jgi:hypothetical protein
MDFAAPPWWAQAIWLVGIVALILADGRVSRALLVRAGREEPPPAVARLLRGSEWIGAVGAVVVIVAILLRLVLR